MKKKRPAYEIVIVVVAVAMAIVMGAALTASRARIQKGMLLTNELSAMRAAIIAYRMLLKDNPASLSELTVPRRVGEDELPFLERIPGGSDDAAIDPFGNPYTYDARSGWVMSQTPGYERW